MITNIIITGIGGQGVISAAGLLRSGIISSGYRLTGQDNRGGAQRLGHVAAVIRYTDEPGRPMAPECPEGECDLLIALEISEGLRFGTCLGERTTVVNSSKLVIPTNQRREKLPYVSYGDCKKWYEKLSGTVHEIDGDRLAEDNFGMQVLSGLILLGCGLEMISQTKLLKGVQETLDANSNLALSLGMDMAKKLKLKGKKV